MNTQFRLASSLVLFFSLTQAQAKSFKDACPDLRECIKSVSALTHDQYITDSDLHIQKADATEGLELTAQNANLLFTTYLNMNQLSRVPVNATTFRIVRVNDAKGMAVPHFNASVTEDPNLPDTADIVNLTYTTTHPESIRNMENIIRTFSNMGARIYGDFASGTFMITSSANEIKTILPMIRKIDVKIDRKNLKSDDSSDKKAHAGPGEHAHKGPSLIRDPKNTATPDPK